MAHYGIGVNLKHIYAIYAVVVLLAFALTYRCDAVPSPEQKFLPALSSPRVPVKFQMNLARAGGFTVTVNGETYPVESFYSYPNGGENQFLAAHEPKGEPSWRVATKRLNGSTYEVTGEGKYYSVHRRIKLYRNRISVKDTISNRTKEVLGIILKNQFRTEGRSIKATLVAGYPGSTASYVDLKTNPTVFIAGKSYGLGMLALDDVYVVQCKGFSDQQTVGVGDDSFALDGKASYTLEWAVYPNDTGDYYDFINAVRKDEGRNGKVDGGFTFLYEQTPGVPSNRRLVPSREFIYLRGLKYASDPCISNIADDVGISLEGIEFMQYPMEKRLLTEQFASIHKIDPGLKVMFHIAHALYATSKPKELFPDSVSLDRDGKQIMYGEDHEYYARSYFSKEKLDAGWRNWIFHPTRDNSFGKAMLKAVDVMMDEMGCNGAFLDGFMWPYGAEYIYNRWDGHSADIDPKTKTVMAKKGSPILLSQDLLVDFARKINSKGGVPINNSSVSTRTINKVPMVWCQELHAGPHGHLTPTPISLGSTSSTGNEVDLYNTVREALAYGNLYFYYREGVIKNRSVPAEMYPITFEEIHSGYVKGKERLITMNPGLYGWHESTNLHFGYLYDSLGVQIPNNFLTTVDRSGARTQIDLDQNQTAVLKWVPVSVKTRKPVNALVQQYDSKAVRFTLNGAGSADVTVSDGEFHITPGTPYQIHAGGYIQANADMLGRLSFSVSLKGETLVTVSKR
ncbi:MAG: hypothetical protein Q7J68_08685 [Thermoplasmata archaeon]|nr:hypothetical protein [Thermoplasmata archaeon]